MINLIYLFDEQDTRDELGITNVQISKAHFMEALEHYPLGNTVQLQKLRGPSLFTQF